MKLITSIIEVVAYFAAISGIAFFFYGLSIGEIMFGIISSVILVTIGYGLNKWELSIEKKRKTQVKHIDYIVLKVVGWVTLVATIVSLANPIIHSNSVFTFSQLIWSVYLIFAGSNRKSMYLKMRKSIEKEESKEDMNA